MASERRVFADGEEIRFLFEKKRVKNINLRVRRDGTVSVSAPMGATLSAVDAFVCANAAFIRRARERVASAPSEFPLRAGDTVYYFGTPYRLTLTVGARALVFADGEARLSLPTPPDDVERAYFSLLGELLLPVLRTRCAAFEAANPRFAGKAKEICVRKMRTMWGNCRPKTGRLTFSALLATVPLPLVDSVIAHEYVHFLHADHSAAFHLALEAVSPNHRALARALTETRRAQTKNR